MRKNVINFEMINNKTRFGNVGATAVNRMNDIDRTGSDNGFGRFVMLLLCCEYINNGRLKSRLTKQQLRHNFTRKQRFEELPLWVLNLKGDKIIKSWDVSDVKQLG